MSSTFVAQCVRVDMVLDTGLISAAPQGFFLNVFIETGTVLRSKASRFFWRDRYGARLERGLSHQKLAIGMTNTKPLKQLCVWDLA